MSRSRRRLLGLIAVAVLCAVPLGVVARTSDHPVVLSRTSTADRCGESASSTVTVAADPQPCARQAGSAAGTMPAAAPTSVALPDPNVLLEPSSSPLVFGDDFEATGNLDRWNGHRGLSVQSKEVFGGAHAARATTTGAPVFAQEKLPATHADLYYRVRFKVISQGANSVNLLRLRTAANDAIIGVFVSSADRLGYRNDMTGASTTSTTLVTTGTWHEVQLHLKVNGRAGEVEIWLDGKRLDTLSGHEWFGTEPIGRIELGDSTSTRTYDVAFDDVSVSTVFLASDLTPAPIPGTLTVQTFPKLAGVHFVLDGRTFVTNGQGVVRLEVARWSSDLRQRIVVPEIDVAGGVHARLARWYGWSGNPNSTVYAVFDTSVPVSWTFIDLQGKPVDPALVSSITFKSSTGVKHAFTPAQHGRPQLLQSGRAVPTQLGLQPRELYYTVETATVGGADVVIRAKQRYWPSRKRQWTVQLLFYSATFRAHDALFGFPTGSTVNIVGPDGRMTRVPLGPNAEVTVPKLPRGEYHVSVSGPGYSPARPVSVSRNQMVDIDVISYLDMAFVGMVLAVIGFGLLFVGRPFLFSPRFWVRASGLPTIWRRLRRATL